MHTNNFHIIYKENKTLKKKNHIWLKCVLVS